MQISHSFPVSVWNEFSDELKHRSPHHRCGAFTAFTHHRNRPASVMRAT